MILSQTLAQLWHVFYSKIQFLGRCHFNSLRSLSFLLTRISIQGTDIFTPSGYWHFYSWKSVLTPLEFVHSVFNSITTYHRLSNSFQDGTVSSCNETHCSESVFSIYSATRGISESVTASCIMQLIQNVLHLGIGSNDIHISNVIKLQLLIKINIANQV